MKTINFFAVCLFALSPPLLHSQSYGHATAGNPVDGQQSYILPKAAMEIKLSKQTTTLTRTAPYIGYTPAQLELLRLKYGVNPSKYQSLQAAATKVTHQLIEDSIKLRTLAVPDYSKIYYVTSSSKWNKNQSVTFTYGVDGMITEAETTYQDMTFDLVVKGISTLTGIAGVLTKSGNAITQAALPINTDVVIDDLDAIIREYSVLNTQISPEIYKDLKKTLDKKYMAIFAKHFYKEEAEITSIKAIWTPSAGQSISSPIDLFAFNAATGDIMFSNALGTIEGKNSTQGAIANAYQLNVKAVAEQQSAFYTPRDDKRHQGIAFNIPLKVVMSVKSPAGEIVFYDVVKMPQWGIVGHANTKRKDKVNFSLDPLTGELKKLTIEGKAITSDQIGSGGAAITDAMKLFEKADPDTELEKEVKRLENEKKRRDLLLELATP